MADDIAKLGLEIDSKQLKTAIRRLDRLEMQAGKTERSTKRLGMATSSLALKIGALAAAAAGVQVLRDVTAAGVSMQKMLNTLDVATGNSAKSMEFLRAEAERLGLDLETSATSFAKIAAAARGTSLEGAEVERIFTAISTASTAMGLSADQTQGALRALEQMISKGNVQAEELRGQLGERLPGAFQLAAKAMGKTTQELNKMLDNGEVLAADLLPKLATVLLDDFGEGAQTASSQAQAQFNRLSTSIFELNASIAKSGVIDTISDVASSFADAATWAKEFFDTLSTDQMTKAEEELKSFSEEYMKISDEIFARATGEGPSLMFAFTSDEQLEKDAINLQSQMDRADAWVQFLRDKKAEQDEEGLGVQITPVTDEEQEHLQKRLDILNEFWEAEYKLNEAAKRKEERLAERAARTLASIEKNKNTELFSIAQQMIPFITKNAKAQMAIQAALAMGETFVNYQVASARALAELGPVAGAPVAAAMQTAMVMSMAAIAAKATLSMTMGGSGSTPSFGGSSGGSTGYNAGPVAPPEQREEVGPQYIINVINEGDATSFIRTKVIPTIQGDVLDRDIVLISDRSRNAQDLAEVIT